MSRRMRQHEIDRALREQAERDQRKKRNFWHNLIVIKVTVMLTFCLSLFLPAEHSQWVGLAGNLLWLWRT
jgi:hypothetical protein